MTLPSVVCWYNAQEGQANKGYKCRVLQHGKY